MQFTCHPLAGQPMPGAIEKYKQEREGVEIAGDYVVVTTSSKLVFYANCIIKHKNIVVRLVDFIFASGISFHTTPSLNPLFDPPFVQDSWWCFLFSPLSISLPRLNKYPFNWKDGWMDSCDFILSSFPYSCSCVCAYTSFPYCRQQNN